VSEVVVLNYRPKAHRGANLTTGIAGLARIHTRRGIAGRHSFPVGGAWPSTRSDWSVWVLWTSFPRASAGARMLHKPPHPPARHAWMLRLPHPARTLRLCADLRPHAETSNTLARPPGHSLERTSMLGARAARASRLHLARAAAPRLRAYTSRARSAGAPSARWCVSMLRSP